MVCYRLTSSRNITPQHNIAFAVIFWGILPHIELHPKKFGANPFIINNVIKGQSYFFP